MVSGGAARLCVCGAVIDERDRAEQQFPV
jgi:hypothetical protein